MKVTRKSEIRKQSLPRKSMLLILSAFLLLTACAGNIKGAGTPEEAMKQTMEAAKQLDLKTFNAYTDNYIGMSWNFIGFPAEKEYKVFNELLQPYVIKGNRYEEKRRFAEKVTENLEWRIDRIQEKEGGKEAEIELTLTNKDMSEAMGRYAMWIAENTAEDIETGLLSWSFPVSGMMDMVMQMINECDDDLIRFIDETDSIWTTDVTVTAYKEGGNWKIRLTDEFINALTGNMDAEEYSDKIEEQFEEKYEEMW